MKLKQRYFWVVAALAWCALLTVTRANADSPGSARSGSQMDAAAAGLTAAVTAGETSPGITPSAGGQPSAPAKQEPAAVQVMEPGPTQAAAFSSVPMRVMAGKSLLITAADHLRRVSVTDPAIADPVVVAPNQVLIHGRSPGEVSLILWDEQERSRSFDLRVDVDLTALQQEIARVFPSEKIAVSASRSAVILNGHVATKEDAERVASLAGAYSKNVVNVLTSGPVGAQEVLLEVKFAEVDRLALTQVGINVFSTGAGNVVGTMTTQQFGNPSPFSLTDKIPASSGQPFTTQQTFNDLLNLFLFSPQIHLGTLIKAMQQKNLLQILAEPNLIAVNGKESSFLAGGEFPYPVVQPSTSGYTSITITFKEYGIKLKFTPLIMPNGNIHLQVAPEVSSLDYSNAFTLQGFVLPAISTRRASTEVELQDGQSFAIAGLLDRRVTNIGQKFPGLGDLPIFGNLFKSKSNQKSETELMVLVTVHRVQPTNQPPAGPKFPEKFMAPETSPEKSSKRSPKGG
jgi:pilus assembly protein CpaC